MTLRESMKLDEYQQQAAHYMLPQCRNLEYLILGLNEEAGEVAGKRKKQIRKDPGTETFDAMIEEIGDCLWYASQIANFLHVPLSHVAQRNLDKLQSRLDRDKIKGSGDKR